MCSPAGRLSSWKSAAAAGPTSPVLHPAPAASAARREKQRLWKNWRPWVQLSQLMRREMCNKVIEFWPTLSGAYAVASLSCESRTGNTFWTECEIVAGVKASMEEILITKKRLIESVGCQHIDYNDYSSFHMRCQCDTACQCCFIWCGKLWQIGLTLTV